ncbi:hypothetical protein SRABI128_05540 [Microbacterium sp. Bi128]|nr:hypothetical protein SRABI128_05540 [Microbacterium sp. Bi128]
MTRPRIDARVSTPRAPTLTPTYVITRPSGDQSLYMLTVDRPVTQIVDTAVNSASASGARLPSADAAGREKSAVNSRMRMTKTSTAKRAGEAVVKSRSPSHARNAMRRTRTDIRTSSGVAAMRDSLRGRNQDHGTRAGSRLT